MTFFDAFTDELKKIAEEFEPNEDVSPGDDTQSAPEYDYPNDNDERSVPEQIVEEGRAGSPVPTAIAGFASPSTRDRLTGLMHETEGRQKIRTVYDSFRDQINDVVGVRKALTRGLLRSRRDIFGPSSTPRKDLNNVLFKDDVTAFEASFAR